MSEMTLSKGKDMTENTTVPIRTVTNDMKRAVASALDYIQANYHAFSLSVEEVAKVVSCSQYHFGKTFKSVTGVSPGRYISHVRYTEAMRRLRETNDTFLAICHGVGFSSGGQFTSHFRELLQVSPTQYREMARQGKTLPTLQPLGKGQANAR